MTQPEKAEPMVEHTAGPWAVHPMCARIVPAEHIDRPIGSASDPETDRLTYAQEICAMHWPDRNRSEAEVRANARLIAAAPGLLSATRAWIEYLAEDGEGSGAQEEQLLAAMRAALTKAQGGEL